MCLRKYAFALTSIVLGVLSVSSRAQVDLTDHVGITQRYESGVVPGGMRFPRIEVDIAVNGFHCFDYVFLLHSAPE